MSVDDMHALRKAEGEYIMSHPVWLNASSSARLAWLWLKMHVDEDYEEHIVRRDIAWLASFLRLSAMDTAEVLLELEAYDDVPRLTGEVDHDEDVVRARRDLSANAKLAHSYLLARARDGRGWPTITEVQEDLGVARPTAVRVLKELRDAGLVSRSGDDVIIEGGAS